MKITLMLLFTVLSLNASSIQESEQTLINTLIKKVQQKKLLNKSKEVNGRSVENNTASIILRLKKGVTPTSVYNNLLKVNKLKTLDVSLIKSFPLVEQRISITAGKQQHRHILVLQAEKISLSKLMSMAKAINGVELVEKNHIIHLESVSTPTPVFPNDSSLDSLWGMHNEEQTGGTTDADIDAPEAWEKHQGSSNVVVGVIDTGIDYNHPDLVNNVWVNYAELNGVAGVDDDNNGYVDDIHGIDTVNSDTDPIDDQSHGTHCAGTIAAEGNNTIGVVGVNWRAKVAACKFLSATGSGSTAGAIECVNYFTALKQNGVNIVATNNSWGGGGFSQALKDAIDAGGEAGIIFVAAAGNSNSDNEQTPHYPSSYESPSIIAVAATNHDDTKADFSSYGLTSVDMAAPGKDILSTVLSTSTCTIDSNPYFSESFESGIANWSMSTVNPANPFENFDNQHWKLDVTDGATGSNSLSDSLGENYYASRLQSAVRTIDLSGLSGNNICASLKVKGNIESHFDHLQIYASYNGGASWQAISPEIDGEFTDWTEIGITLNSAYFVSDFKIAITRYSDSTVQYEGYNIDDITIGEGTATHIPQYATYSGTSMATPHVAGAVAFFASIDDSETIANKKARILNSVDVLPSLNGLVATSGRLNINNYLSTLNYEDIIGEWTMNYNWTTGTVTWTFNDDFTFTTSSGYSGKWTYNGTGMEMIYLPSGTTYSTTALDLTAGTMSGTMFVGSQSDTIPDGNWTAIRDSGGLMVDNDFNGDGVSDVLIRNSSSGAIYSMLLTSDGSYQGYTHMVNLSNAYSILETARLNSDNVSDILLRHTNSGRLYSMIINSDGTKNYYKSLGEYPESEWTIEGVKDLTGDGIDDILISNNNSGNLYTLILKADGGLLRAENHGNLAAWLIAGIADLNGDGINDILIKRISDGEMYSMLIDSNGEKIANKIIGTYDPNIWSIEAVAKFNNDNTADVMIKNTSSGQRMNLLLNNNGNLDSMVDLGTLSTSWVTSNIGDYNGDGIMDVQIQSTTGKTYSLLMNPEGTRHSYKYVAKFTPSSWTQYISSNHNDDTTSDLLLQRNTGRVYTWIMDNNANSTLKPLGSPSSSWVVKNK